MRVPATLLIGLAGLFACVTTPLHERAWIELRTPHFEIVSSLDADATRELARDAELFHAATEFVIDRTLPAPRVPTRIYAFDGRGITRPFAVRGARGHFLPTLRENLVVLRAGGGWRGDATESLRHAYAHFLVRQQQDFTAHLWFEEGSAQLLSTLAARGDQVALGRAREDHVRLLRGQPWRPLHRVLRAEDLEGWGDRERQGFYAASWALLHFLTFGLEGRDPRPIERSGYLRRVAGGVSHRAALREAFGVESGELDRRLRRYLREDRFDAALLRLGPAEVSPARALAPDEVLTRLGWLSIALGRREQAQDHFERAVALHPGNARAHAGLGTALRLAGHWDSALPHYERALAIGPDDALNQLDFGVYYQSRAEEGAESRQRAAWLARARRHYARSGELDDSLPEAPARYGASFLLDGEPPERGREPLERAARLLPASLEIQLLRARLARRLDRPDEARALALAVLSRSHREATREAARELLDALGSPAGARERSARLSQLEPAS